MLLVKSVKTPTINPACLLPDTIGLLEADQCIDCISAIHYENKYQSEDAIVKDT